MNQSEMTNECVRVTELTCVWFLGLSASKQAHVPRPGQDKSRVPSRPGLRSRVFERPLKHHSQNIPPQHKKIHTAEPNLNEMASTNRKPPASTQAEVALLPGLKNCLLNLPASLVNVLLNSNAVVQNVVVELSFRQAAGSDGKPGKQQSVFLGWTGMRSQTRRAGPRQEQEVPGVEVDGTFGRLLGLKEGMKVRILYSFCFEVVVTW